MKISPHKLYIWSKKGFQSELIYKSGSPDDSGTAHATNAAAELATCAIVGVVSPERLLLEGHGNYKPKYDNGLQSSKLQSQLVAPTFDPDFESDFKIGVERLEQLQSQAYTSGPRGQHFIVWDGHQKALKFNWNIFEKRTPPYNPDDDEDWTNDYPIPAQYKAAFETIAYNWRVNPLPAYNSKGLLIKPQNLEVTLRGSLVLVYFQLKHYSIKEKGKKGDDESGVTGNTFTATAIQVTVLEAPTKPKPSPYRTQLMKGPVILPQSPTKRKEQIAAVHAFHQNANAGPRSTADQPIAEKTDVTDGATLLDRPQEITMSKAEGKKRSVDEDGDGTATDGETSTTNNNQPKKKKKQIK